MPETYIDTEEIESVTIGTEGLELNFSDGTGYYIETDVTPDSGYINVNDIKGWETWNDNEKVYLSVGDWVIMIMITVGKSLADYTFEELEALDKNILTNEEYEQIRENPLVTLEILGRSTYRRGRT